MLGKFIGLLLIGGSLWIWNLFFKKIQIDKKLQKCLPSHLLRQFFYNLVVGIGFLLLMVVAAQHIPRIMEVEESALDVMMYFNKVVSSNEDPSFVLLDIDKKTTKKWRWKKDFTPRDKLMELIDAAITAEAQLVIVDIDLHISRDSHQDQMLKNYLVEYSNQCQQSGNEPICPHIIFAREFVAPDPFDPVRTPFSSGFLEEIVTSSPHLHLASAGFFGLYDDKKIRRWNLWEQTCTEKKQSGITPSIALLANILIQQNGTEKDIQNAFHSFRPKCGDDKIVQILLPKFFKFGGLSMSTIPQDIRQRIVYRIRNENSDLLRKLSVNDFLENLPSIVDAKKKNQKGVLSDKIVVIGSHYGRDIHSTPIGNLPGSLLVINSIYTSFRYGTIEPVASWVWLVIAGFFVFVITIIRYYFPSSLVILGEIISIVLLVTLSAVLFFYHGIWLNITSYLMIMQGYYIFEDVKNFKDVKNLDKISYSNG